MPLFNSKKQFGLISKICHWIIFFLVVLQFALIYIHESALADKELSLKCLLLHKSFGLVLLVFSVFMLCTKLFGSRPKQTNRLAKAVHFLLYFMLLLMPLSGIFMSKYAGYNVGFFGQTLPLGFIQVNEGFARILHALHVYGALIIAALIVLHIIGAFYHQYVLKDEVLKRML